MRLCALILFVALLPGCSNHSSSSKPVPTELQSLIISRAEGPHITVYFHNPEHESRARVAAEEIERSLAEVQPLHARLKDMELALVLLTPEKFHQSTKAPYWVQAIFHKGRIFAAIHEHNSNAAFVEVLRHETGHALIAHMAESKVPRWLDEGFAMWFAGPAHVKERQILADRLKTKRPYSLEELNNALAGADPDAALAAYAQARFAVELLLSEQGLHGFAMFLEELQRDAPISAAFLAIFKRPLAEFNGQVARELSALRDRFD